MVVGFARIVAAIFSFLFVRREEKQLPIRTKHAFDFLQNFGGIQDVFERVMADGDINRVIRNAGNVGDEINSVLLNYWFQKLGNIVAQPLCAMELRKVPTEANAKFK